MLYQSSLPVSVVVAALSVLLIWWVLKKIASRKEKCGPPSPPGIPLLGHLPYAGRNLFSVKCMEWAKTYGPVFSIQLGAARVVILNDINSIKKYFSRKEVLHRPHSFLLKQPNLEGVGTINGQAWVDNRFVCMNLLRNLGYGKESMKMHLQAEANHLVDMISIEEGRPINIRSFLLPSLSNTMTIFLFGERYPFEDARKKFWDDNCALFLEALASGPWIEVLPSFFRHFAVLLPFERRRKINSFGESATEFIRNIIRQHKEAPKDDRRWDFIDHYLEKINESQNDPSSSFTESYLIGNIINLFVGGTFTALSNIQWHMLNCAHSADGLQIQIQNEIDRVIGPDRQPTWEDHLNMPFTMAVIWEMLRCKPSTATPRGTAEDIIVDQYFIPKGTMIMRNNWALDMNPDLWKDPEKFKPERFLNSDGSELVTKPEHFIPFSYGKRMCPGETLGRMQIFLYVTTLLQKFRVLKKEGETFNFFSHGKEKTRMLQQELLFLPR